MAESREVTLLSTGKKDEAAFYLSELARGLLKNHVAIRGGEAWRILSVFDSIQFDIRAHEKSDDCTLAIRLSWRKAEQPGGPPWTVVGS